MRFILLLLLPLFLYGKNFTLASYNVENLFDLVHSGSEYPDYIPFGPTQWDRKNYTIKLKNIAKVIKDIDADIVALQEVESDLALKHLQTTLKSMGKPYRYRLITSRKKSTVHSAILSRFPIISHDEIMVKKSDNIRSILKAKLDIEGHPFTLFVNHWKSKRGPESKRLGYAKELSRQLRKFSKEDDYIIVGDLNSNYDEFKTFKRSQKLNDTHGITGINHYLLTAYRGKMVTFEQLHTKRKHLHYNLWMELPKQKRFSQFYRGRPGTLDHMIIPKALADSKGIDYLPKSFHTFAPEYLLKKKRINRWKFRYKSPAKHMGRGYSDHLPIVATFSY